MLVINIIGAGRLGKTIGKLIVINKAGSIQGICNQSLESSLAATKYIGEGLAFTKIADLPPADITLITTPDRSIKQSARELSKSSYFKKKSIVLHCSGALTSCELESLKSQDCSIASVHPMHSFASPDISLQTFKGTYCAMEGDEEAKKIVGPLFSRIGGINYSIPSDKKIKYHVSGVIASNYVVTLCDQARKCLVSTGVDSELAMKIVTNLMKGTIDNLATTLSPEKSLTGPVKRGDKETLLDHLSTLEDDKPLSNLYRMMGALTVGISNHEKEKTQSIIDIFEKKTHTK